MNTQDLDNMSAKERSAAIDSMTDQQCMVIAVNKLMKLSILQYKRISLLEKTLRNIEKSLS